MAAARPPTLAHEGKHLALTLEVVAAGRCRADLAGADEADALPQVALALRPDETDTQVDDRGRDTLPRRDGPQRARDENVARRVVPAHGVGRARVAHGAGEREEA